jgi:hypothetical protein
MKSDTNTVRCIGLCRWFINIIDTILCIIHRHFVCWNRNAIEAEFYPVIRWNLSLLTNWVSSTSKWRQNPVSETLHFIYKAKRWIISRVVIVMQRNVSRSGGHWLSCYFLDAIYIEQRAYKCHLLASRYKLNIGGMIIGKVKVFFPPVRFEVFTTVLTTPLLSIHKSRH